MRFRFLRASVTGIIVMSMTYPCYAPPPAQYVTPEELQSAVVAGNTAFAIDLYHQLAKENDGDNLFFSPFSMSSALAMTYEGARGDTALQIYKTLHLPMEWAVGPQGIIRKDGKSPYVQVPLAGERIHPALGALSKRFSRKDKPYQLAVANSVWGEQSIPFRDEFVNAMSKHYNAGPFAVDFKRAFEPARRRINAWGEDHTNKKIKDLVPPGSVDAMTRLVLVNAIYFKGDWASQFDKRLTSSREFTLSDGSTIKHDMMGQPKTKFPYMKGEGFAALSLPYKGDELAMIVLLPDNYDGLAALEEALSSDMLAGVVKRLRNIPVVVQLPKFKLATNYQMSKALTAMGMAHAFTEKADLTGLVDSEGGQNLYIDQVCHKAFVEVNEVGTEAAAATAVAASPFGSPLFYANRPFMFLIRDDKTGTILFMGRVTVPIE